MSAFYNENDAYPAAWLRNLALAGHIAQGTVDERSIRDIEPSDLDGYEQAHFFAGIGAWSYALRLAGVPDDAPVWTGSCPCQPFSVAGQGRGHADERHLWPAWFRLIRERRPVVVFGEQVAGAAGERWLDAVQADMEAEGYTFGSAELCAAGVGAPHRRQRLFFGAHHLGAGLDRLEAARLHGRRDGAGRSIETARDADGPRGHDADGRGDALGGADAPHGDGWSGERGTQAGVGANGLGWRRPAGRGAAGERPDADGARGQAGLPESLQRQEGHAGEPDDDHRERGWADAAFADACDGATRGFWSGCDWWYGRDGKWRPAGPGVFPLAHGATSRVGRLRAYGNAIVAPLAAEFVSAFMDTLAEMRLAVAK